MVPHQLKEVSAPPPTLPCSKLGPSWAKGHDLGGQEKVVLCLVLFGIFW